MATQTTEYKSEYTPMRKQHKIQVEKRRRTRINDCLSELKTLLLQAMQKENSPEFAKLEKADILDMTVRYLRSIQHQQVSMSMTADPLAASKYTAGFTECASEVLGYINTTHGESAELGNRVGHHLTRCLQATTVQNVHHIPVRSPTVSPQPELPAHPLRVEIPHQAHIQPQVVGVVNHTDAQLLMSVAESNKNVSCVKDLSLNSHEGLLTPPAYSPVSLKVNDSNEYQGLIPHYYAQYSPEPSPDSQSFRKHSSSHLSKHRYSPYSVSERRVDVPSASKNVWRPW